MTEKFGDKSNRSYDQDVSKRFGFQTQIQSSNPPTNPHWTYSQGPGVQPATAPLPPTAPLTLSGAYTAPPPPSGTYVGPNLQPTNQMPQRDRLVECARCSLCFIVFGVFLTIVGIIMLSTASHFDVDWIQPPPTNPQRIIGPIALTIGILFLVFACILITAAKKRVAANSQNRSFIASNFGGPQPVISGGNRNRIGQTSLTFNHETSDFHHNQHQFHDDSSSNWNHQNDSCLPTGHHHDSSSHSNHHDVSSSHCHDHGSSTVDSPPSYDSVSTTCDASPSTTND